MVFKILTTVVFISELIIAFAIISLLIKADIRINSANRFIDDAKPKLKSVFELIHAISEQLVELTPIWVEKMREIRNKIILSQLESLMSNIVFWTINIKLLRKFKKSKLLKFALKGLSLVQNMV